VPHPTVRANNVIRQIGLEVAVVVVDQFAGAPIGLGMGVQRRVQGAAKRFLAFGFQRQRIKPIDAARVIPGRQQLAVVQVQRRVRRVLAIVRIDRNGFTAIDARDIKRSHDA
jgi:hypothetical protein